MSDASAQHTVFQVKERTTSFVRKGLFPLGATTAICPHPTEPGRKRWVQLLNLFEGSDRGTGVLGRVSDDSGKTWRETGIYDHAYRFNPDPDEKMMKLNSGCIYDERSGAVIRFVTEYVWKEGSVATILDSILRKRRIYYRLSYDSGETWTDGRYIHQQGGGWDRDRMFPGITFGVNMLMPSMPIIVQGEGPHKGDILVGVQIQKVDPGGKLINPATMGFFQSGCLFGSWNAESRCYDWTIGDHPVEVPYTESTRGVYEPCLSESKDGTIIMILRGSNTNARERIPGTKWISVSDDQGATWRKPERLGYEDGSLMYSSSSYPCLVRDQAGSFYYVGIVNGENPDGNLPRYPLCAAKLDSRTLTIEKDSVTTIVTKDPQQEESGGQYPVDFSNQSVLWEEQSRRLIVFVPNRPDLNKFEGVLLQVEVEVEVRERE